LVIGWSGEQTLKLEGTAEEPQGAALKQFQDDYFAQSSSRILSSRELLFPAESEPNHSCEAVVLGIRACHEITETVKAENVLYLV
jgi:hypothetical protein